MTGFAVERRGSVVSVASVAAPLVEWSQALGGDRRARRLLSHAGRRKLLAALDGMPFSGFAKTLLNGLLWRKFEVGRPLSVPEVERALHRSESTAKRVLRELIDKGVILRLPQVSRRGQERSLVVLLADRLFELLGMAEEEIDRQFAERRAERRARYARWRENKLTISRGVSLTPSLTLSGSPTGAGRDLSAPYAALAASRPGSEAYNEALADLLAAGEALMADDLAALRAPVAEKGASRAVDPWLAAAMKARSR